MMHRKHGAYSLYKKRTLKGDMWYVRFWNRAEGRYTLSRSTGIFVKGKKGRRGQADEAAREMLGDMIFCPSKKTFVQYLTDFWMSDSIYARECALVDKKPLSLSYIKMNSGLVRLHVAPYYGFKRLYLPDITPGLIRDWMLWEAESGASGTRINKALQAMRVPVRYAISRDELKHDPFDKVKEAVTVKTEKGILSRSEICRLLEGKNTDPGRAAVLLGLFCGMRLGEVRGLYWEDIQKDVIHICHNWQDLEGVKKPKCDSERTVPIPGTVKSVLRKIPRKRPLVFGRADGKPLCNASFRNALIRELKAAGIDKDEQRERNISFHSLRHTYVTLGRLAGISDIEIRALAGHKSLGMVEHYSHVSQVFDYGSAKKKLETAFLGDKKNAKFMKKKQKNA